MTEPLVSIGLPTYNRAHDLDACLANLTGLDYKNIEIIISDNHSTDTTAQVCKKYIKKDKRISYYRQNINGGVSKNSLFVLEKAKGKYFFWASDDDLRKRKYLTATIPLLEKYPKATLAITDTALFTKMRSWRIPLYFNTISHTPTALLTYIFHPECVSVLLYGVHRLNTEFRQGIVRSTQEKRLFGIMGYDNSLAVYFLLRGDLLYVPRKLFFIRDNGMYLSAYQNLAELKLSKVFFQKAARYLRFPLMFLYDWFYGSLYIYKSSAPLYLKPVFLLFILLKLAIDGVLYVYSLLKGLLLLCYGMLKKLVNFLF